MRKALRVAKLTAVYFFAGAPKEVPAVNIQIVEPEPEESAPRRTFFSNSPIEVFEEPDTVINTHAETVRKWKSAGKDFSSLDKVLEALNAEVAAAVEEGVRTEEAIKQAGLEIPEEV